ncbi:MULTISPECIES: hypothetical protein [unclassified Psychrobacillus]|uniref:hypothetical protein n=1 Tax=unclassified Psychrobacillus TaxID=2636677 RepID=UPI0030FB746B
MKKLKMWGILVASIAFVIGTLFLVLVSLNHLGTTTKNITADRIEAFEASIVENFEYNHEEKYEITDKYTGRVNAGMLATSSAYYLVGLKGEEVFKLRVPSELYYRTIVGEELTIQEGDIEVEKTIGHFVDLDHYEAALTSDGTGVIYSSLIEE